jgi:toxin ParE1/3/4
VKELVYLSEAEADINEIWDYTADHWDFEQADGYIQQITRACVGLANGTLQGRSAADVRSGYRKRSVGSHVVYYQESPDAIVVIRILHQRMDASSQIET